MRRIDWIRKLKDEELINLLFRFPTCYWCRQWRGVGLDCDVLKTSEKTCLDVFKEALESEVERDDET